MAEVVGQQNLVGVLKADSDAFLNAAARERVAGLCRVRQEEWRRALPAREQEEPQGQYGGTPAALPGLRRSADRAGCINPLRHAQA
ncbi:hypothetical protein ACFU8W_17265 [Streptomyces sp. NPDC057565]|uniref:hypothetical protein n=1 Tax=Streptomyces sp. NPDC057565 TaxID=3346169 RepID=UPI003673A017